VQYPESLVAAVLAEYTSPGDRVLDPFAGYGTTLVVAERMRRAAVGVELLGSRRSGDGWVAMRGSSTVMHGGWMNWSTGRSTSA
jgi:hypothetical protein